MNVLDLFSGIGGFSLGLERAGMRTVAFCEIDPFCRRVLAKHWPDATVFGDIRTLRGLPLPGPIDWRSASGPEGTEERPALRPDWIVVENVGHTWRRWVPELRRLLWSTGYASLPFRVRASDVGAQHERSRIFVVAHANGELLRELQRWWLGPGREMAAELAKSQDFAPRRLGADDGLPDWVGRRRSLGNSILPQISEILGRGIMSMHSDQLRREVSKLAGVMAERDALRLALEGILASVKSHVDGRDLLDELHPRKTLDIKRRVDGVETWFEGDWLSNLRTEIIRARLTLAATSSVPSPERSA